jgi:SAM-dependent methyltransferase
VRPGTRETLDFLLPLLPRGGRVLEVGCGEGGLAKELGRRGLRVRAVDASAKAVAAARARGVDARRAEFPDYRDGRFDAVLFTRSLHHVRRLDAAADRAAALVGVGGLVACEDFDLGRAGRREAAWLFAAGGGGAEPDGGAWAWWSHEHRHEPPLHHAAAMGAALKRRFAELSVSRGPYLYRYVDEWRGPAAGTRALARERAGLRAGTLRAVGWRFVGARR